MAPEMADIVLRHASKQYRLGQQTVWALHDLNLRLSGPGLVALVGPSGSGKSTLLHIVGAMDGLTSGKVRVLGKDLSGLSSGALTAFRRETIGFVFQNFYLIPNLTALENVVLPMIFARQPRSERVHRAKALLEQVGLGHRQRHRPAQWW